MREREEQPIFNVKTQRQNPQDLVQKNLHYKISKSTTKSFYKITSQMFYSQTDSKNTQHVNKACSNNSEKNKNSKNTQHVNRAYSLREIKWILQLIIVQQNEY